MFKLRSIAAALALAAVLSPAAYAASSDKTFTISNTGDGPLTITVAAQPISGNPTEFALLSGHNCTTVAAGGSCAMTVRFTPTGSGTRTAAALNFTTNGTNGGAHSIALSGTGGASCTAGKQVYSYTGYDQVATVPAGCSTATIKAWGAGGGVGTYAAVCSGAGGFAQRTVTGLTTGDNLVVMVGRGGTGYSASYGGGGAGALSGSAYGGSGGGLSGVFVGSKSQTNALVIAGGGGGTYLSTVGGAGGGASGLDAKGMGGTQTAGGAPGTIPLTGGGGVAGSALQGGYGTKYLGGGGTGGGGGYFGGGGAGWYGGGGGSGYAPGGTLITGSGATVANSSDSDYTSGIGNGACAKTASGQNGRVVLIWQ
jgi:hypothetical protein